MRVYSLASINQEPAPWEELRPRPTRALGGGERMLMTADPRIPDKISKKQRELDRIAAEDAAKAEMLRLKAEKEAREFAQVFANRAKIFALEEEGKSRRLAYFGRPAQQERLMKFNFHHMRLRWEQQAAMWQHLLYDADAEIAELKVKIALAKKLKLEASNKAGHFRGKEKGTALAAASLGFAEALAEDRQKALAEAAMARKQRFLQEVGEERLAQEEEKKRCASAKVIGCRKVAFQCLADATAAEITELETVNGEVFLVETFIAKIVKKMETLAPGSPPYVAMQKEISALAWKKCLLDKERRMFVPCQTKLVGHEVFKERAPKPGQAKVNGKQRAFKWMVQLQKEGQTILGGGLGGALTERFFVVDAANKVLRLNKMLRDCLAPSVGDEKVKHMCKALEKLYTKEDVAERPPLQGLKDLLSALDDKTVKIANRPAAKALRKPLLQFYELERGNPERDGGGVIGCKEISIEAVQKSVQLFPDVFCDGSVGKHALARAEFVCWRRA